MVVFRAAVDVMAKPLATLLSLAMLSCAADRGDDATSDAVAAALTDARALFCPPGTEPDLVRGYCVDPGNAYGPFTRVMRERCVAYGGGPACDATLRFDIDGHAIDIPRWSRGFADALRGTSECPPGASRDPALGACVETGDAFGPFPTGILALCVLNGGGDACYTNRWSREFLASLAVIRRPNPGAVTTLEYHDVVPGTAGSLPAGVSVTTGHIARLANGYAAARHLITFDDGYATVAANALPVLQARGVPAVAAIIVEATRDSGSPDALSSHMSRAELATLARAGWALALHSGTVAEHELDYARMATILHDGILKDAVDLADAAAVDVLGDLTGAPGEPSARLLAQLRVDRAAVLDRVAAGAALDEATIATLAERLIAERLRLAELSGVPAVAIDTFVYPHSESNELVRAAAARAGFTRAYAGGPIGDAADPYNLPRRWMNDASPIP